MITQLITTLAQTHITTIMLGDFNEDILNTKRPEIPTTMATLGFTQLVQSPTTDYGSLLDHIYYNKLHTNIIVQVVDTYFSDHDMVYCSLPFVTNA